jgi:hypothetical protein
MTGPFDAGSLMIGPKACATARTSARGSLGGGLVKGAAQGWGKGGFSAVGMSSDGGHMVTTVERLISTMTRP